MATNLTIAARGTAVSRLMNVDVYDWQGAKQQVVYDNQDGDLSRNANVISFKSNILDGLVAVKRQGSPIEWSWKKADATGRLLINKPIVMIDFASPKSYRRSGNTGPFALPPGGSVEVITSTGVKKMVKDRKPGTQFTNDFDDRANAISVPLEQGTSGQLVVRDAKGFVAARFIYTNVNAARSSIKPGASGTSGIQLDLPLEYKNTPLRWEVRDFTNGSVITGGAFSGVNARGHITGSESEWNRAYEAVRAANGRSSGYLTLIAPSTQVGRRKSLAISFPIDRRVSPNRRCFVTETDASGVLVGNPTIKFKVVFGIPVPGVSLTVIR